MQPRRRPRALYQDFQLVAPQGPPSPAPQAPMPSDRVLLPMWTCSLGSSVPLWLRSLHSSVSLECSAQRIPPLKFPTAGAILAGLRGLVKVLRTPLWPTTTGQHHPVSVPFSFPQADEPQRSVRFAPLVNTHATSRSARGLFAAIMSSVRAAPDGERRPCSHS